MPNASERSPIDVQRPLSVHLSLLPVTGVALSAWKGAGAVPMALPSPEAAFVHTPVCFAVEDKF